MLRATVVHRPRNKSWRVKKVTSTGMEKALKMVARKATRRAMKRATRKGEKMGVRQLLKRGTERGDVQKSLRRDSVLGFTVV
jgi:hypothetical protein